MNKKDISIVLQGSFESDNQDQYQFYQENIRLLRELFPDATIILSTWEGTLICPELDIDLVVYNKDPGGLIGIKKCDINKANNINRQIVSTYQGLKHVTTFYAIKLRTDCYLEHSGFIKYFLEFSRDQDRILSTSFFTIDPTMYEHMPYHISDWFQFGKTESLIKYWDVPLMTKAESEWYLHNKYAQKSGYFDREFISKFAVEQYLAINYAKKLGYLVPEYHNDDEKIILNSYYEFLAKEIVIIDPSQAGLKFPKYSWVYTSVLFSMSCINFLDWYKNYTDINKVDKDDVIYSHCLARKRKKLLLRKVITLIEPISNYWYPSLLRKAMFNIAKKIVKIFH